MEKKLDTPNNAEIDNALKQFEAESQAGQIKKNSEVSKISIPSSKDVEGVKFEVPNYGAVKYYKETDTPKIVKLVIKLSGGAIKEEKHAEWILLGFVVVMIIISLFLFYNSFTKSRGKELTPEQQNQMLLEIMPKDRPPVVN